MTRKRFKKLLMGCGYSRDNAERLSIKAQNSGLSYSEYWHTYSYVWTVNRGLRHTKNAWAQLGKSMKQVAESFSKWGNAVKKQLAE